MKLILTVISGLPEECYDEGIRAQVYDESNDDIEREIKAEMGFDQTVEDCEMSLPELLERYHPGAKFWRDELRNIL
jgi:hypothetical protein